MKKKKGMGVLSWLIILLCLAVAGFSAWKLWGYYQKYHDGEKEYEKLTDYVKEMPVETQNQEDESKADTCPITVDFEALAKINSDIVGWVYIPDSEINYPIVQNPDNEYYLHHTFEGTTNFTGAIFLDALCQPDFSSDNSIVYGHNLKTGAMFGSLKKMYDINYNKDADYREHPVIWILTPEENMEYRIFASREISAETDTDVYLVEAGSDEEYSEFLTMQKEKSSYETETELDDTEPMLTLSTCTSNSEDGRFVVQAIRIQSVMP